MGCGSQLVTARICIVRVCFTVVALFLSTNPCSAAIRPEKDPFSLVRYELLLGCGKGIRFFLALISKCSQVIIKLLLYSSASSCSSHKTEPISLCNPLSVQPAAHFVVFSVIRFPSIEKRSCDVTDPCLPPELCFFFSRLN